MKDSNELSSEENSLCTTTAEKSKLRVKPRYSSEYSEEAWEVKVSLPGVTKNDLDVSIEKEILTVKALRNMEQPEGWKRLSGDARNRQYELNLDVGPEVDDSKIEAKLENGELLIRLPLRDDAKPRAIPVS